MYKERKSDIDILRGIGIFFMVAGHIYFGMVFDKYIHAFHMPMFFIISGYLYKAKEQTIGEILVTLKGKARSLLIPYLFFSVVAMFVWIIFLNPEQPSIKTGVSSVFWINTVNFPVSGALWFLTALFFVYVLACFINMQKYLMIKIIMVVIFLVLGTVWSEIFEFRLPFGIDVALVGVVFFAFGYGIKMYMPNLLKLPLYVSIPTFVLVSFLCMVNGYVNLRLLRYSVIPLFLFNSCAMTVLLWNICRSICNKFTDIKLVNFICQELRFIGQNSIVYLCLNQIVILVLTKIISFIAPTPHTSLIELVMLKLSILSLSMLVLHLLVFTFKYKFSFLIGKNIS